MYSYTDYRAFLTDHFRHLKGSPHRMTLKSIAKNIGMKSAGNLTLVLKGRANISLQVAQRIAGFCDLKKKQFRYFMLLVQFSLARTHAEKQAVFEQIISFPQSCVYRVHNHQHRYYDKWYHSVVRALCEIMDISDNYGEVARAVIPPIRPDEARASLALLEETGLIAPDENGKYRPNQESIDSGTGAASVTVNKFALEMLDRGKEAIDRFPRDERIVSWVTAAVSDEGYAELVDDLRAFRSRAAQIAQKYPAKRVYQINVQVFPVSRTPAPEDTP